MIRSKQRSGATLLLTGLVLLAMPGCGGGKGGGGPVVAVALATDFSGQYCRFSLRVDAGPTAAQSSWGYWTPNGVDQISGPSDTRNVDGTIIPPGLSAVSNFTISSTGAMAWHRGGPPLFSGGLMAGGALGATTTVLGGLAPALYVTTKRGAGYSNASLDGTYHVACFYQDQADYDGTTWGTATFDSVGGSSFAPQSNADGVLGSGSAAPRSYTVAGDGACTWGLSTADLQGWVLLAGQVVVLAGATNATDTQLLVVLIRAGAGLSESVLSGTYHAVGLVADNSGSPKLRSTTTTAVADGFGSVTLNAGLMNEDGVVGLSTAGASGYAVTTNGTLTAGSLRGGVTQDGRVAALAGGTTAGDDPEFWLLFK